MAKRKTPKAEKVIDLTPKADKITKDQLSKVQASVNSLNRLQLEVGITESRKHSLLHQIAGINDEMIILQNDLEKDYGTWDVDLKTGKINYPTENGETNKED